MIARYRCHTCGAEFTAWAPCERHSDAEHHHRIDLVITPNPGSPPASSTGAGPGA